VSARLPILLATALVLSVTFPIAAAAPLAGLSGNAALPQRGIDNLIEQIASRRGITRTSQLPTQQLRNIRAKMVSRRRVSFADMRLLADTGDGLAALLLAKRIESLKDPKLSADAVHYYSRAAYAGRVSAIPALVRLLRTAGVKLDANKLKQAETALQAHVGKNSDVATNALANFYRSGAPFGLKPGEAERLLRASAERGNLQAAFDVAVALLVQTPRTADMTDDALKYLEMAKASDKPGLRAMAETLARTVASSSNLQVQP
jgi:hypothetical protein